MQQDFRRGATLTEVLIALLIMSIGLVALAVLFPISVLRSIKATQFTTATDNRYNAEAMIDLYPNIVHNPDYRLNALPLALDPTAHANDGYFIVDPLGYAESVLHPESLFSGDVRYSNYFGYDPTLVVPAALTPPLLNQTTTPAYTAGSWYVRRYPLTWTFESAADYLVTMPDSWVLQYQGFMVAGSAQTVPAAAGGTTQIDVNGLAASGFTTVPAGITARAVIFSADGLTSQARFITSVGIVGGTDTVNTIKWTEDINGNGTLDPGEDLNGNGTLDLYPLPASFIPGGKVRIELQERRYTWLLTVRKSTGAASVDIVVFFKRRFNPVADELLYPATFTAGSNQATVTYTVGSAPRMEKGNFVFEANNGFWYRISNVIDNGQGSAQLVLETPANLTNSSNVPGALPPRAMFPRNIVDVYPIGSKK
jgi:hypothetical protein